VHSNAQLGRSHGHRDGLLEGSPIRYEAGTSHDTVIVGIENALTDESGEREIVGIDYQSLHAYF